MKWQPSSQYKDPVIENLGRIPESWQIMRLKYCSEINMGQSPRSYDCNLNGIGLPFLQGNAEFGPLHPTPRQYSENPPKTAHKGDFLISVRAPVGALNIADQDYGIGRGLCGITIDNSLLRPSFSWYLLNHVRIQLNSQVTGSTYDAVSASDIGNIRLLIPSLPEQLAIETYLKRKTANIDSLLATKEQQIELLQEKRITFITNVVTKGLNPDVQMKDSGIETLGEIPAHWALIRSKAIFDEVDERSVSGDEELLTVSHLTGVRPRSEIEVYMFLPETFEGYKKCKSDDLVINTMWAWMGALGISDYDGIVSPSYNVYRFREKDEFAPKYLDLLYRTPPYVCEIGRHSKGIWKSRLRLYPDSFFEIYSLKPPLSEQRKIVNHVAKEVLLLDNLIEKLRKSIDILGEYRNTLISAAVTGNINIRNECEASACQ